MMTTDELITKLKGLGVDDEQAEGFRDLRLQVSRPGGHINIPVFAPDNVFYNVEAVTTDKDQGYVPRWDAVSKLGGLA